MTDDAQARELAKKVVDWFGDDTHEFNELEAKLACEIAEHDAHKLAERDQQWTDALFGAPQPAMTPSNIARLAKRKLIEARLHEHDKWCPDCKLDGGGIDSCERRTQLEADRNHAVYLTISGIYEEHDAEKCHHCRILREIYGLL